MLERRKDFEIGEGRIGSCFPGSIRKDVRNLDLPLNIFPTNTISVEGRHGLPVSV